MEFYPDNNAIHLTESESAALGTPRVLYELDDAEVLFNAMQQRLNYLQQDPGNIPFGRRKEFELESIKYTIPVQRAMLQLAEHLPNDTVEGFERLLSEEDNE